MSPVLEREREVPGRGTYRQKARAHARMHSTFCVHAAAGYGRSFLKVRIQWLVATPSESAPCARSRSAPQAAAASRGLARSRLCCWPPSPRSHPQPACAAGTVWRCRRARASRRPTPARRRVAPPYPGSPNYGGLITPSGLTFVWARCRSPNAGNCFSLSLRRVLQWWLAPLERATAGATGTGHLFHTGIYSLKPITFKQSAEPSCAVVVLAAQRSTFPVDTICCSCESQHGTTRACGLRRPSATDSHQ